ncbi:MAG: PIN domain-containing protein [Armatimonadetes bacterium]|nr:PIN domain-containing protein [Armatimonadota bacterium]
MAFLVMDSSALIALLRQEVGHEIVLDLVENNTCCAHAANMCEIYYGFRRDCGDGLARQMITDLALIGVTIREDMDDDFWLHAGALKADYRRISLADCFGVTLAQRMGGEFVTTDHHELDSISQQGVCPIRFVR